MKQAGLNGFDGGSLWRTSCFQEEVWAHMQIRSESEHVFETNSCWCPHRKKRHTVHTANCVEKPPRIVFCLVAPVNLVNNAQPLASVSQKLFCVVSLPHEKSLQCCGQAALLHEKELIPKKRRVISSRRFVHWMGGLRSSCKQGQLWMPYILQVEQEGQPWSSWVFLVGCDPSWQAGLSSGHALLVPSRRS